MKKIAPLLLGLMFGALCCHFLAAPDKQAEEVSAAQEPQKLKAEAYQDFLSQQYMAAAYDSSKGKFISANDLKKRENAFEQWANKGRIHNNVYVPSSFFIGKDSLEVLIARSEASNRGAGNGSEKVAGFVIQFTLVEDMITYRDTNGNEITEAMNRIDPVLIPARINKKRIIRDPKKTQGIDGGTILDDSLPCPDQC